MAQFEIGNLEHILLVHQKRLYLLKEEKLKLWQREMSLQEYDDESDSLYVPREHQAEYDELYAAQNRIEEEMNSVSADIVRTEAEMKYKARRMFPKQVA